MNPTPPSYTQSDVDYIQEHLGKISYPQMAKTLNLSLSCIKRIGKDLKSKKLSLPKISEPNHLNRTEPSEPNHLNRSEPETPIYYDTDSKIKENISISELTKKLTEANEFVEKLQDDRENFAYQIAELTTEKDAHLQTIDNLSKQIEALDIQLEKAEPKTKLTSFREFTRFLLSDAKKTGSNSYSIDEIKFRRSDLKNIYLIYLLIRGSEILNA